MFSYCTGCREAAVAIRDRAGALAETCREVGSASYRFLEARSANVIKLAYAFPALYLGVAWFF